MGDRGSLITFICSKQRHQEASDPFPNRTLCVRLGKGFAGVGRRFALWHLRSFKSKKTRPDLHRLREQARYDRRTASGLEPFVAFVEGLLDEVGEGFDFVGVLRVGVDGEPGMELHRFGE